MQPTVFGALIAACAPLLLLFGSIDAMLMLVLALTLLGGASAITLTALGGASIMPANFAVFFLILRMIIPGRQQFAALSRAVEANAVLVLMVLYGVAGAFALPHIFARAMYVTPLHPHPTADPFASEPLVFTSQNVTVSVYFTQTLLVAIGAYIVASRSFVRSAPNSERAISRLAVLSAVIGITHAVLGILSVVAKDKLSGFLNFFRNGAYAQLNQEISDVSRMNGIFPEPSNYAAYGFAWLVFLTELWLRNIRPRWTGPSAALLALALTGSTSSTAYIGVAAYGLILIPRLLFIRDGTSPGKLLWIVGGSLAGAAGAFGLILSSPGLGGKVAKLLTGVTLGKSHSLSALQRGFWAKQGLDAFVVSKGLGIGCGSFRSSSLITAILGTMGVIGIVSFLLYLLIVFKPLRRSTWVCGYPPDWSLGAAASWASVIMVVPLSFTAPAPDPGLLWGIFCGLAVALRGSAVRRNDADVYPSRRDTVTTVSDHGLPEYARAGVAS